MLSEIQLRAYYNIRLWRDQCTGKVRYEAPKESMTRLAAELSERVNMFFSKSNLHLRLPYGSFKYGTCEQCGGEIDPYKGGICLLCVVAFDRAVTAEKSKRFCFVDTETTGKNPQKCGIIEVALLITDTLGIEIDRFYARVKLEPDRHYYVVEDEALAINHYSPERWEDAITLEECLFEMVKRIRPQDVLIAWNVGFDSSIIASNARLVCNSEWRQDQRKFDAMSLAAPLKSRGVVSSKRLIEVAKVLGVEHSDAHAAMSDVCACRDVFFFLINNPDYGIKDARSSISTTVPPGTTEADSGTEGVGAERGQDAGPGTERQEPSDPGRTDRQCGCDGYPCPPWHPR